MKVLESDGRLFKVRLYREDLNFSAGHISTYEGSMEGQHGHNYQLSIEFEGPLNQDSLVVDFRTVKRILRDLIKELNHRTLVPALHPGLQIEQDDRATLIRFDEEQIELPTSGVVLLGVPNVTSEMLALYFYEGIFEGLPDDDRGRIRKIRVEVIESPGQSASYEGPV